MDNNDFQKVSFLKNKKFFIPSYQRGYRWTKEEVFDLLKDIKDFMKKNQDDNNNDDDDDSIYSLQPIVLKLDKEHEHYRVIDGQQRLTTIFIIIKYLKQENFFEIKYETRAESDAFLKSLESKTKDDENYNIDFYHFVEAYHSVQEFFSDKDDNFKEDFYTKLTDSCYILWYKISEDEKEEDVFIRLNIGKIPLMVEENIKALFLVNKTSKEAPKIAKKWYESEKELRKNNDFRFCVLKKIDDSYIDKSIEKPTISDDILRIRVYLDAISPSSIKSDKDLFEYFYGLYKDGKLKEKFRNLKECMSAFNDFSREDEDNNIRKIFHYIGFLILTETSSIKDIYKLLIENGNYQEDFAIALKNKIKDKMLSLLKDKDNFDDYIRDLYFDENKKEIYDILLLANIHFMLQPQTSISYFKFNMFQLEKWSLEHIYAQNSKGIKSFIKNKENDKIEKWLNDIILHIENIESSAQQRVDLLSKLKSFVHSINYSKLDTLLDEIDNYFRDSVVINSVGNLCLLDKRTNSSIGNLIFSEKRKKIIELERNGRMIPLLTEKVFNKDFPKEEAETDIFDYFSEQNMKDYVRFLVSILEEYFKK